MVYYQSTPLIIKSEQPSQAQLCGPLRTTSDHHQHALQMQHSQQQQQQQHQQQTINTYSLNNVAINMQMSQNNANSSISNTQQHLQQQQQLQQQHQQHQQYLTNIKSELLPPGITLYATSQPASLTPPANNQNVSSSSPTPMPTSTMSTGTGAGTGRKTNPNKPQFKCEQCGMTFGSKSAHTSHTKSHAKNGELALINGGGSAATTTVNGFEISEMGLPLGIPKTPQIKPNANAVTNGGDPYQCNVCQKTFAVPARLVSISYEIQ